MKRPGGKEFEKFVDESILFREREETQGRLQLSLFIAGMGAIAIGVLKWTGNLPVSRPVALAILAAPAVAVVLGLINYGRAPTHAKVHKKTVRIVFLTAVACVATYVLAVYFSLLQVK
jgi:hypothetical protein